MAETLHRLDSAGEVTRQLDFDPYLHDPARWGVSMGQLVPLLLPCLESASVRSILEIGAYAGDLTRILVAWAETAGARVGAVDPAPQPALEELARESDQLELIRETSLEALQHLELPDAIVIDGDHNYHTVSQELKLIGERSAGTQLPLLLFHDVGWPHGRRDDYFDPEQIPVAARHPTVGAGGGISPGNPGVDARGLPYPKSAAHEGGPRNGVLTAIEDFASARPDVRLVVVPAFFGFGVAWERSLPYSSALGELLDPFDRHPLLQRLEDNRIGHLAEQHRLKTELWDLQREITAQRALLERLLDSSAFSVAERLSNLRSSAGVAPGASPVSKRAIRDVLAGRPEP